MEFTTNHGEPPNRDWDEAHLINQALDVHADDPAVGYGIIAEEVNAGMSRAARSLLQSGGFQPVLASLIHSEPLTALVSGRP